MTCNAKQNYFIDRSVKAHNGKYDYSKAVYVKQDVEVEIICPTHGSFFQIPKTHVKGHGCQKCGGKAVDEKAFIPKAIARHGDRYDYSKTVYRHSLEPVTIICRQHGEFEQTPTKHLTGPGCKKCSWEKLSKHHNQGKEEFVRKSKLIHGDRYDYSNAEYIAARKPVSIICREHGEFTQEARSHLQGNGCPYCAGVIRTTERFIEMASERHNGRYTYERAIYVNSTSKIAVTCVEHCGLGGGTYQREWLSSVRKNNCKDKSNQRH